MTGMILLFATLLATNISYAHSELVPGLKGLSSKTSEQAELEERWQIEADRFFGRISYASGSCRYAIATPDRVTRGTVSLTFDDGPQRHSTTKILDVLRRHRIKATFFVQASNVKGNEDIVRRMIDEGHQVANHSYKHSNACAINSERFISNEIQLAHTVLAPYLMNNAYFRFPFGNSTTVTQEYVRTLGYKIVGWNIDTCDWAYAGGNGSIPVNPRTGQPTCLPPNAYDNYKNDYVGWVVSELGRVGGGIILLHDVHGFTAHNLDALISRLISKNYRFVDLDDTAYFPRLNQ